MEAPRKLVEWMGKGFKVKACQLQEDLHLRQAFEAEEKGLPELRNTLLDWASERRDAAKVFGGTP